MPTYDDLKARSQSSCSGDCKVSRPGIRRRLERAWAGTPVDCRPRSDDVPDRGVHMNEGNLRDDASSVSIDCSANKIGASAPSACGCSLI